MNNNVIIKPIISEKSMKDVTKDKFTFRVSKEASKNMIEKAVTDGFKVDVVKVFTTIVKGRSIRVGARRTEKSQSDWKKAIVKLKKGQKIALFDIGGKS